MRHRRLKGTLYCNSTVGLVLFENYFDQATLINRITQFVIIALFFQLVMTVC